LGSGSGFVVSNDGKVVTNYHVIHTSGAVQAEVRLTDGASYQIQGVLATDPDKDLAVLRLQAVGREFRPLHLAFTEQIQIGEHVVAIGSPLAGLAAVNTEATVSDGIVSGIRDWPEHQMKVLQITAPISPGSSGGALVNSNSDVIGVTFAQIVGGQNLNFAIPIAYVRSLLIESAIKSLAAVNTPIHDNFPKIEESTPTGSYTGVWQSSRFGASGAAQMTISIMEGLAHADIFLTGGEVASATLGGTAHRTGENIWTMELASK
jgi:serine protease Do